MFEESFEPDDFEPDRQGGFGYVGDPLAQRILADSYFFEATEGSLNLAHIWYEVAASQGDSQSEYMIGLMKYHGLAFDKDINSAIRWFIKSCNHGNSNA